MSRGLSIHEPSIMSSLVCKMLLMEKMHKLIFLSSVRLRWNCGEAGPESRCVEDENASTVSEPESEGD